MIDQYPHQLYILRQAVNTPRNADGDFLPGVPVWEEISVCREEVNGKGLKISTVDGKLLEYASVIYMPEGVLELHPGAHVQIRRSQYDIIRKDAEVINFESGQLNCRAWL